MVVVDPSQGDHVFNELSTAVLKPFDAIRSMPSAQVNGQDFLCTHLFHTFSMAQRIARAKTLLAVRKLVATGHLDDTVRDLVFGAEPSTRFAAAIAQTRAAAPSQ